MSDANLLQSLVQISNYHALRSDQGLQMQLQRFWADELAKPRNADPKRLLRYGFKMYSQCDEDGIIQEIFRRIGTGSRAFVEFGVETGIECNTVKLLIEGWRGLWLDGSPTNVAQIRSHFDAFLREGRLEAIQSFITAENINSLIRQGGITGDIDLLSIDIDRNDYWVWQAIEVVRPRVVVIEYNATLRPPLSGVVPYEPMQTWNGSNYFGASLEALVRLGRRKGYRLVGCSFNGANAFFVQEACAADHFLDPPTAEEHYEPPRYFFSYLSAGHRAQPGPFVEV
ncbi:MAG: hypothetical protein JOY90_11605 [Bradyrhizobium sp.]|uniref:hypothetical protein n=1 Tax=Bradyrhizobium sp. TaxID=376 RepID=UPI001D35C263|nr:hypothetical protein [Bradyrhizobium sp.]MBV9561088.1 hypothetical protein [Bradyrhizobium sp.]